MVWCVRKSLRSGERKRSQMRERRTKKKPPHTESTYEYTIGYARLCRCHLNAISDAKQEKGKSDSASEGSLYSLAIDCGQTIKKLELRLGLMVLVGLASGSLQSLMRQNPPVSHIARPCISFQDACIQTSCWSPTRWWFSCPFPTAVRP